MIDWYIGCSGFHYKHWKGSFYPEDIPQRKWFEYYCQFYNTLELNVTFYKFPKVEMLKTWYDKTPAPFRFAVKAPRAITHFKQFKGAVDMISDFYSTTRTGLQEKLGCVLFQMPPKFVYTEERMERILNNLDSSFSNVMEFRHSSWWNEAVYKQLSSKNISFCGMSHPDLPKDIIANTSLIYYRLHGEGQLYASSYENDRLKNIVKELSSFKHVENVYAFFNNDIHTYAIFNSLEMKKLLTIS